MTPQSPNTRAGRGYVKLKHGLFFIRFRGRLISSQTRAAAERKRSRVGVRAISKELATTNILALYIRGGLDSSEETERRGVS
jgi:hypothetical protein